MTAIWSPEAPGRADDLAAARFSSGGYRIGYNSDRQRPKELL